MLRVVTCWLAFGLGLGHEQWRFLKRRGRNLDEHQQNSKHCRHPLTKRKVKWPESLVGRAGKLNFDTYSGYIKVTVEEEEEPEYLFYLFYTSQDQDPNAPLIVWLNGGPGCSSMEGATTENSPLILFDIKGSGQARAFSRNLYSINAHANVLYLDQPRRVGFSYGYGSQVSSTKQAAADVVCFLREFTSSVFPEFAQRQLVLSGESYAGQYIPAFASAIMDFNAANPSRNASINLAALAIGNGCINSTVQEDNSKFFAFLRESNLLSSDASTPSSYDKAMKAVTATLGYRPNAFDYRLGAFDCLKCSGGYNYTAWAAWMFDSELRAALHTCGTSGTDAFKLSGGCISFNDFDKDDTFDYTAALGRALDVGIQVRLFYGKTDLACHYVGGLSAANAIPWREAQAFRLAQMKPLYAHGEIEVGQVRAHGGLSFYQLEQAGHMSFIDQPASVAVIFLAMLKELALARNKF